ncbi:MAG: hypothetical protein ACK5IQ_11500 [Bacteroidales bacterium]
MAFLRVENKKSGTYLRIVESYKHDGSSRHRTLYSLGKVEDYPAQQLERIATKLRNPITYNLYRGNTYEGATMTDALKELRKSYSIDNVIAVADSAMIDRDNRKFMEEQDGLDYILGDRIKNLPQTVSKQLIDRSKHQALGNSSKDAFSYTAVEYQDRKIICTYSLKRARKEASEREKLIGKAERLIKEPSKLKQSKRKGAGRFIKQDNEEHYILDIEKIKADEKWMALRQYRQPPIFLRNKFWINTKTCSRWNMHLEL